MRFSEGSKNLFLQMALFFSYIFLGAVIFQALEAKNEDIERKNMEIMRQKFQQRYNISDSDMRHFLEKIEEIVDHGFSREWVRRWSLLGALFFAGTVVTTIGYGHVTPCTLYGRVFCIFYALIGIPLTWLLLSTLAHHINEWIGMAIRYLYEKFFKTTPTRLGVKTTLITITISAIMIIIIATFGHYLEGWSFFNGIYFGFITLTTIGFGDYVPLHPSPERNPESYPVHVVLFTIMSIVYFTIGLALVSSVLLSIRNAFEEKSIEGFQIMKDQYDELDKKTPIFGGK